MGELLRPCPPMTGERNPLEPSVLIRSFDMALTKVLVISTIPLDDKFGLKTAFQTALGQAPQIKDNIGYNKTTLQAAIGSPGADTLVVTVGGLAAALAADEA